MTMQASENGCARWAAKRIAAEVITEQQTILRQPIDMRRLVDSRPIRADGVRRVIIAEVEYDVWAACRQRVLGGNRPTHDGGQQNKQTRKNGVATHEGIVASSGAKVERIQCES